MKIFYVVIPSIFIALSCRELLEILNAIISDNCSMKIYLYLLTLFQIEYGDFNSSI